MIFIDKMKNLKVYKTPMFLPTLDNDKKKHSAAILLTPNSASSKKILSNNTLLVNQLRFASYYLERDISYYINSKIVEEATGNDNYSIYQLLTEITASEKSKLSDSEFGLPEKRKYPLDTEARVRSAIKFFNYVSKEDEKELADNIIKAIKKYDIKVTIGEKNRLKKYYTGVKESVINESGEDIFYEDTKDDVMQLSSIIQRNKKITNIVFDIGNVLSEWDDWREELKKKYAGLSDEYMDKLYSNYEEFIDETDTASYEDARIAFVSKFDDKDDKAIASDFFDIIICAGHPYDYVDELLSTLKNTGYKLYYLSNWSKYSFEAMNKANKMPYLKYFDDGLVSYEVGFMKPSDSFYNLFYEKMGLDPKECVFFDDKKENVDGAKATGMNAYIWGIDVWKDEVVKEKANIKCPKCGSTEISTVLCSDPFYKCNKCGNKWGVPFPSKESALYERTEDGCTIIYPLNDDLNSIKKEYDYKDPNGISNSCVIVNGYNYPFRLRSEMLIFNQDKVFVQINDNETYKIPGGGLDSGENPLDAAIRESQEEARINIKNGREFTHYIKLMEEPHGWVKKIIPAQYWWYGYYTHLCIGEYDGEYTGKIADVDKDDLYKNGKWISIYEAMNYFDQPQRDAIQSYISGTALNESALYEHITKIDDEYRSKGAIDLNSLVKVKLTKANIDQYEKDAKFLKHFRTGANISGVIFFKKRAKKPICAIAVEEKKDGKHWIQALEVSHEYRGYGLGKQMLKYACEVLHATHLSVSHKNEIAQEMYKKYGFRKYKETQQMQFYTIDDSEESKLNESYHFINESEDASKLSSNFKKKSGINCKIIDMNDPTVSNYIDSKMIDKYKNTNSDGAYAVDLDKKCHIGHIFVSKKDKAIGNFEISKKYKGYGIGEELLSYAIDKLGGNNLWVYKDNEVAINLYKKFGFKIDEEGTYKGDKYIVMSLSESYLEERVLGSTDDLLFNFPKEKFGDKNIIFITGLSGSGKSTRASNITNGFKDTININLDKIILYPQETLLDIPDDQLQTGDIIMKEYLLKNIIRNSKKNVVMYDDIESYREFVMKFLAYIISISKKKYKSKIFIVEGIQLMDMGPKVFDLIGEYPIVVTGTSLMTSMNRAVRRSGGPISYFKSLPNFIDTFKWYFEMEDQKKQFLARIEESYDIPSTDIIREFSDSINTSDKIILFGEDAKSDMKIRQMLYSDRIKQRKDLLLIYDAIKKEFPYIKYTYPDLDKYQGKNIFIDTYYYMELFCQNNDWTLNKGFNLFFDFMTRLLNVKELERNGYTKKTIFIPVIDWDVRHDGSVWNYKVSGNNPISIIYHLLFTGNSARLEKVFKDMDIIFLGSTNYFKINLSQMDLKDNKKIAMKIKNLTNKMCKNEEFDADDVDTSADNFESKEVVKAKIIDKIELSKGVDLTKAVNDDLNKTKTSDDTESKSKAYENDPSQDNKASTKNASIKQLAQSINVIGDNESEDEALDNMDNEYIKNLLIDLDSGDDDGVNITAGRAARITSLDKALMSKRVNGRSIQDILDQKPKELEKTDLKIASPNEDNWKGMSYINFDKEYDIDKDIVEIFKFFSTVSRPLSITEISATDNSTSEDRVMLYEVHYEDYNGKRFTVKLDIPIMEDNRLLLRGNDKAILTQLFNMPIIKTDEDCAQIVSNYMKIMIYRVGNSCNNICSRLSKALNKYTGRGLKITLGDNEKICSKYELPVDYIELSSQFNTVESDNFIIYFSQDEIRNKYDVDLDKGIPYTYDKKTKTIMYFNTSNVNSCNETMSELIYYILCENKEFKDTFDSTTKPTSCLYSRCNIMNSKIPLVIVCAYSEGLRKVLNKAGIHYTITDKLTKTDRSDIKKDWIKFSDGYIIYEDTYDSSMLLNGLKICNTENYSLAEMDNKNMYLEFLDDICGKIKADGLDNFYDCFVDPLTKRNLEFYNMPTDYVSMLLYANCLLADNKFFKHTDASSKRYRRCQLISAYTYKALSDAYSKYANECKHNRSPEFFVKQSAVIDLVLTSPISSDDSCINALRDVETTNSVTAKGPSGLNSDRAYSLDKRTYDDSMINVLAMSTGFSGNTGLTRQTTMNSNIEGEEGYVKSDNGNINKMNTSNTLSATEAMIPFGSTHDDPMRTAMSFIQTAKHQVKTAENDPPLVVNGAEEAMAYMTTNRFAYKARMEGKVIEYEEDDYILIEYKDGKKDYINLKETIEKNSDGGYFVPLKLTASKGIKIGKTFIKNDILAYDEGSFSNSVGESDNIAYTAGKLAKIAIINSDEGFEDSAVITEKLAKSLATRVDLKFEIRLDKDTNVLEMMKIGEHIEAGHPLMSWQTPFEEEEANNLMKLLATDKDSVSELGKRTLDSEVTGTITDIRIFRTVEIDDLSDSLKKIVTAYEAPIRKRAQKLKKNGINISKLPAHEKLPTVGKLKKCEEAVLIEYYVEYVDTVGTGDKVVYYSANKGVEKNVIPEGKEPYTDFRPNEKIDAFVSETSISKRIVTSTMLYGGLQKLMIELDRSVKDILGIPYDDSQA